MQDILYLSNLNPIKIESDPSDETKKLAKKFVKNPDFRKAQKRVKQQGYAFEQSLFYEYAGKSFFDLPISQKVRDYLSLIPGITLNKPGQQPTAFDSVILMLCSNTMIDVRSIKSLATPLFRHVVGKTKIAEVVKQYSSGELASILTPYSTSKSELIQWVDDSWDEIKSSQKILPKFHTNYLPQDLEIHETIYGWRNQGWSFKQIVEELLKKYPNDKRFMDESSIRKMYERHVKYVMDGWVSALRMSALFRDSK